MVSVCTDITEIHNSLAHGERFPFECSLELTWNCNLKCRHCYLGASTKQNEASLNDWKKLADQLADAGVLRATLTGGEPLTRRDFSEIYSYFKQKGIILVLFTNGVLFNDNIINLLKDMPPAQIEISLYGSSSETYKKVTGVAEAFDVVIKNAKKIVNAELPLNVKMTACSLNYHEFDQIKNIAAEIGAGFRCSPNIFANVSGETNTKDYTLSHDKIIEITSKLAPIDKLLREKKNEELIYKDRENLFKCKAGMSSFCVNPELEMHLCLLYRLWKYDLRKGNFTEGWQKLFDEARNMKRKFKDPCVGCEYFPYCSECPAMNLLETGNIETPSADTCNKAKMNKEHYSKIS